MYRFGSAEFDPARNELRLDGRPVPIRSQVGELLHVFLRHSGQVLSKQRLTAEIWDAVAVGEGSLTSAINELRAALGDSGRQQGVIRTHRDRGYELLPRVVEVRPRVSALRGSSPAARLADLSRIFVGRDEPMGRLEGALEDARAGRSSVILLSAAAGVGKSRVLAELGRRARGIGFTVAEGRCEDEEGAPSFWPWMQLLRPLWNCDEGARARAATGGASSVLAELLPEIAEGLPGTNARAHAALEPARARFLLFDSVARFLSAHAQQNPLLLMIDDLHVADESSLKLLRFLARGNGCDRMLLVGSVDEVAGGAVERHARLIAGLDEEPLARRLGLNNLPREDVASFLEKVSGQAASSAVLSLLCERSGGNPYLLEQLVRHRVQEHGAEALTHASLSPAVLPPALRASILQQLDGLPLECMRALTLAAVMGRDFARGPLWRLLGGPESAGREGVEAALSRQILIPHPEQSSHLRFAQPLIRDALYEDLSEAERAGLHGMVGEALEEHYGDEKIQVVSDLSRHYYESALLGSGERALTYASLAAERAGKRLAHDEAVAHRERVVELLELRGAPDPGEVCDALNALGRALACAGKRERAREVLLRACDVSRRHHDARRFATSSVSLDPGFFAIETGRVDEELIARLEIALNGVNAGHSSLELRVIARIMLAFLWVPDSHRKSELIDRARSLGEGAGTPEERLLSSLVELGARWDPACLRERCQLAERAVAMAEKGADWEAALLSSLFLITSQLETGQLPEAAAQIEAFRRFSSRLRQPQVAWYETMFDSMEALRTGRFQEVETLAAHFLQVAEGAGDRNGIQSYGAQLTLACWELGRLDEVMGLYESHAARFDDWPGWPLGRAVLYLEVGRERDARRIVKRFAERETAEPRGPGWLGNMALFADASAALGEQEIAQRLYRMLLPYRECHAVFGFGVVFWGSLELQLGRLAAVLGRPEEAAQHLDRAIERNRDTGSRPWEAHSLFESGRFLLASGEEIHRPLALGRIRSAREIAQDLGMIALREKIEAIAPAIGLEGQLHA